ncbi:MAG: AmmeMemoRadiSam system protein B [Rhodocyclaceae bacterium]|jgi:AmmeMemoRadiSam system protein B|nr:AmmeMemoRadiSam system protein B [Rhodocyclaceae bacterium]MCL4757412.1 AmmeMemoRadiSam system protein B [Rhodocyclaceae bacterium]
MASASVRPAAVAGLFYPADPRVLHAQIGDLIGAAMAADRSSRPPKAIVVPHAGYLYSGPVAASGYAAIAPLRGHVSRVVLLGPAHRMAVRGFAIPAAQAFATPFGEVPVSRDDWLALQRRADVVVDDRPHALEHSLEVQLPFLQMVLDGFRLVPILVGDASAEAVASLLGELWGGEETLIVISSDLSHYHPYLHARQCDQATVRQILALDDHILDDQACGARPINGLMRVAAQRGLTPHLLDLRNSGDTAGDRSRVVGYASLSFDEAGAHDDNVRH